MQDVVILGSEDAYIAPILGTIHDYPTTANTYM
jgi:hypothetical protein